MTIALFISDFKHNPVKFIGGAAILWELANRGIDCDYIIIFTGGTEPVTHSTRRVTRLTVFRELEKLLGAEAISSYKDYLEGFIAQNPSKIMTMERLDPMPLSGLDLDIGVLKADTLVTKPVIDCFRLGVVNLHGSGPLPYYRGRGSLEHALIDQQPICLSVHLIDEGIDTGPMLLSPELSLSGEETLPEIYAKMNAFGTAPLIDAVLGLINGTIVPQPQRLDLGHEYSLPESAVETYALKRFREGKGKEGLVES